MALLTILVVLALAAVIVRGGSVPERLRSARTDAELAAMIDGTTAELLVEQLRAGPQYARVRTGHRLYGPFLDIQLDGLRLHLRLYRDARAPRDGETLDRMTGLSWVHSLGWVATFDGPRGPQRYVGWLVENIGS